VSLLADSWRYALDNWSTFTAAVQVQLQLSSLALAISLVICVPLGVLAARSHWVSLAAINLFGTARVIPSIAILFLALPYLGLGFEPALVALTVLACPPILVNTSAGFRGVDRAVVEAASGMGMSSWQVLQKVELPLALPVMLAGIRTATVEVIASATLATFIGGGGLGDFITQGFATNDTRLMLVGAIPVAVLALAAELLLGGLQRAITPS
jgi:osmoprotectant transport system permease protein